MAGKRALICEDDPAIRTLVKTVIKREGFDVDTAEDGRQGLEKLGERCYDLLVLDLMMPGIDGYSVVKSLTETRPAQLKRIIVMTAVTDAIRHGLAHPVCTILAKPFDIARLTAAIHQCALDCGVE